MITRALILFALALSGIGAAHAFSQHSALDHPARILDAQAGIVACSSGSDQKAPP